MLSGYTGRILEIDLSTGKISTLNLGERILRQYVGGRGLAAKVLWDRLGDVWESIDPLGPANVLAVLTGPLTGYIPGGRICVSGKSPASNGIVGSTVAGEFPIELKCAGFDGILVTGKAEEPVYILVTDGKAEIVGAEKIWGLTGKQTLKAINFEVRELFCNREPNYGECKEPGSLYIGPAGESLSRIACVMSKWTHAAGYGGYGAVMGSKKVKAIVAKGTGPLPEVANPEEIQPLQEKMYEASLASWSMRYWGTSAQGYLVGAQMSAEPVRNWQEEWHDEKSFGIDRFENLWVKRSWSDYGCPMACMKLSAVKNGPFEGAITDGPDYELQAYLGPNLGIFSPEENVYLVSLIDDLGLNGIGAGNVMGFAAELYQRGILTREDFGGIEPKWGQVRAFAELAKMIAHRKNIGDVLAEGTYRAAAKIRQMKKVDVSPFAIQVKGIETGAWGWRSRMTWVTPVGYACSTQGGDHTSLPSAKFPGGEIRETLGDSLVFCNASYRAGPDILWAFFKAVTGWNITQEEWMNEYGRRIVQIQRAALLLGGSDVFWEPARDDDNPSRWYEPLQTGPRSGQTITRAEFSEMKKRYYTEIGWDEQGIPTSEELKKLGLEDVDKVMKKIRK